MRNLFAGGILVLSICALVIFASAVPARNTANPEPAPFRIAYAHVLGDGTLDRSQSRNVVAMAGGNGLYCFKLAFKPNNATATLIDDPTAQNQGVGFIKVAVPPTILFTCSMIPNPDAVVETGTQVAPNSGFSDGGYAFYVYWVR